MEKLSRKISAECFEDCRDEYCPYTHSDVYGLTSDQVQAFLDQLTDWQQFKVTFTTKTGDAREYVGALDNDNRKQGESVAFMTEQGFKRFNINNVLFIGDI